MGILRFLLAVSVVVMHCDGPLSTRFLVGGPFAVDLFFIISGFYMALVLAERYVGEGSTRVFYGNRLLRLLPTYYLVLAASLLLPLLAGLIRGGSALFGQMVVWQMHGAHLPSPYGLLLGAIQITPFGQELASTATFDPVGARVLQLRGEDAYLPLFYFMLIPPAWSLSLELQFYAVAPFLARRGVRVLMAVVLVACALRWVLPALPFGSPSFWTERALPCALGYFGLGMLSYRLYRKLRNKPGGVLARPETGWIALGGLLTLLVVFPWLPEGLRRIGLVAALAAGIPGVFAATCTLRWDRLIGELSYPIYMVHWLVKAFWYGVAARYRIVEGSRVFHVLVVVALSVLAAFLVHWVVERPIERCRRRRVARIPA